MKDGNSAIVRTVASIRELPPGDWDGLANPRARSFNPFLSHAFLAALESAGAIGGRTGWIPQHLLMENGRELLAAMPCYVKTHSQGEYVFDYGWAEAYDRAGGRYYPKLQAAVPFTPVPGRRILVGDGPDAAKRESIMAGAAIQVATSLGVSSLHLTFLTEPEWSRLGSLGFLQRTDQQFHWVNQGYGTFDDFLGMLASRKRKAIKKERAQAVAAGLTIESLTGAEITEADWDAFFVFYMDTGSRKWGRPYLNRRFFSLLGEAMAERCLLVLAKRDGRPIAGALNLIGGDCLYGRYWGAVEHHPYLHFELCYYRAIDYAIAAGLDRVEAGAQGEHKLARGYMPTPTYSAHWIADPALRRAVARYLENERAYVSEQSRVLADYAPYRKDLVIEDACPPSRTEDQA